MRREGAHTKSWSLASRAWGSRLPWTWAGVSGSFLANH